MLTFVSVLADEARPPTGATFKEPVDIGHGMIEIINNNPHMDAVAVLKTTDALPTLAIYIRSNESAKYSGIMDGSYNMYFEMGNGWNSSSGKFTDKAGFYKLDGPLSFKTTSPRMNQFEYPFWTVALESAVPNANEALQRVSVNEDDFPALK